MEENTAYLTCSSEFNEVMKIATIKYEKGTCNHNDVYGIGNLCNGRTECLFKVTNSNVGSSCGANGTASLGVTYNCIRELTLQLHYFIRRLIESYSCHTNKSV